MSHWLNNCISLKFSWKKPPPGCSTPGCRARPPCWPPGRWAWSPACRAAVVSPAGWRTDCRVGHGTPWPAGWRWWELRCWTSQRSHHDPTQLPQCRPVHHREAVSEGTVKHWLLPSSSLLRYWCGYFVSSASSKFSNEYLPSPLRSWRIWYLCLGSVERWLYGHRHRSCSLNNIINPFLDFSEGKFKLPNLSIWSSKDQSLAIPNE